jgi:hypothetical protein
MAVRGKGEVAQEGFRPDLRATATSPGAGLLSLQSPRSRTGLEMKREDFPGP